MQGLVTVKRDCDAYITVRKGSGGSDTVAIVEVHADVPQPVLATLEIGPFDTGLDVATWLLKHLVDQGVLAKM